MPAARLRFTTGIACSKPLNQAGCLLPAWFRLVRLVRAIHRVVQIAGHSPRTRPFVRFGMPPIRGLTWAFHICSRVAAPQRITVEPFLLRGKGPQNLWRSK
jgi:hypothetical protein